MSAMQRRVSSEDTECPYVGLQPYTEAESPLFFGRERQCSIIASNLFASSLTVLYGASGVGKSSILRAGVLPLLLREPRTAVVYFNGWQEAHYLASLKVQCHRSVEQVVGKPIPMSNEARLDVFLAGLQDEFRGALMLLLDQFEDFFLYHPEQEGEGFDVQLASIVNRKHSEIACLISLRDDWVSRLDRFETRIPNLLSNSLRLEHLDRIMAEEAIRKPVEVYNRHGGTLAPITLDDKLIPAVLDDVRTGVLILGDQPGVGRPKWEPDSGGIETAYLQLVMSRLWAAETSSKSDCLRLVTYQQLGGARNIVQSHLDQLMSRFPVASQAVCARIFQYLVTPTGAKIAHETVDLVSFAAASITVVRPILEELSSKRVLRRIYPPEKFELFHDVLGQAVLAWRTRYFKADLELQATGERRRARLFRLLSIALATILVLGTLATWYARAKRAEAARYRLDLELITNDLNAAHRLYVRGEYRDAEPLFDRAAARGAGGAMYSLGQMYQFGQGVAQDYSTARQWYERGAATGDISSMNALGALYEFGLGMQRDFRLAQQWYSKAAELGSGGAMYSLGVIYSVGGGGVTRDYATAREWFRKAGELGNASAMYLLALIYSSGGEGISRDYEKAREWYLKSAQLGNASAMYGLATLFLNGSGGPPDQAAARLWLERAAALGHSSAMALLGVLWSGGIGVQRDDVTARQWYEKSAALGNGGAMDSLGLMLAAGLGGSKDDGAAILWYQRAADLGDAAAMYHLGRAYEVGQGVTQNLNAARYWYERAVAMGDANAMYALGELYIKGRITPLAPAVGRRLIERAVQLGVPRQGSSTPAHKAR